MEMQKFLIFNPTPAGLRETKKKIIHRDSLLVTSRGVSGGVSGVTGYQPAFFESKQLIPNEKTASDFKEKAVPPCEWRKKK
jgi:hypothetical protein